MHTPPPPLPRLSHHHHVYHITITTTFITSPPPHHVYHITTTTTPRLSYHHHHTITPMILLCFQSIDIKGHHTISPSMNTPPSSVFLMPSFLFSVIIFTYISWSSSTSSSSSGVPVQGTFLHSEQFPLQFDGTSHAHHHHHHHHHAFWAEGCY